MRNIVLWILKKVGPLSLLSLLVIVVSIAIIVHHNKDLTPTSKFLFITIQNYFFIMFGLVITSVVLGLALSQILSREVEKKEKDSKNLLEIILLFLSKEEKEVLQHLLAKDTGSTQAEISRLQGMNRVKAFRVLQKMQSKNLITLIPNGKVRKIQLSGNIRNRLLDDGM